MKGLFLDKVGLNCTDATDIGKINVGGQEVDTAKRRFAFDIENVFYKLNVSNGVATLSPLPTQAITTDTVLEEGNTAAELLQVTSCTAFAGKTVYPVIALFGEYGSIMPTASLSVDKITMKDIYVYTDQSPVFELTSDGTEAKIISIAADKKIEGNASLDVSASLFRNGDWTEYIALQECSGQLASKVKFRSLFRVRTFDGTDKATLNKVSILYSSNRAPVTGNSSELITITRNYGADIGFASLLVKHLKMTDSYMDAYVALRKNTDKREDIKIGTGTGGKQTLTLGVFNENTGLVEADKNIDHNSLVIKVGDKVVSDYDFNMERSHITVFADLGASVTASYEYNLGVEEWRKMNAVITQPYNGSDTIQATKFELPISDSGNSITATRIVLTRKVGHIDKYDLGYATGQTQTVILPHFARKDTIESNVAFTYNDVTKEFSFQGDKDMPVWVSYDWTGETQEIYSIAPFWTLAPSAFGGGDDTSDSDSSQQSVVGNVDLTRIKQQILYTQAFLAELQAEVQTLEKKE